MADRSDGLAALSVGGKCVSHVIEEEVGRNGIKRVELLRDQFVGDALSDCVADSLS